jgi:hypothetical protein
MGQQGVQSILEGIVRLCLLGKASLIFLAFQEECVGLRRNWPKGDAAAIRCYTR